MIDLVLKHLLGIFSYRLIELCTCVPKFHDLQLASDLGELLFRALGLVPDLHNANLQYLPERRSH